MQSQKKSFAAITGLVCDKEGNTYMSAVIGLKKAFFDGIKAKCPFLAKFDTDGNVINLTFINRNIIMPHILNHS